MKENGFKLTKERIRRYSAQTITNVDYADDIPLLANSSVQALLHSLERAAGGIGFHVNADKTEYMYFNQRGDVSTLNGGPLKLVDKNALSFIGQLLKARPYKTAAVLPLTTHHESYQN